MPSYEEVVQRAGSLRSLTGLTDAEFEALLPHFERAFSTYMHDRTLMGNHAPVAAIVAITPARYPHSQTNCCSF